jgi:hypothetical protein
MKYLCLAYEEEQKLNSLSKSEWDALRRKPWPTSNNSGSAVA